MKELLHKGRAFIFWSTVTLCFLGIVVLQERHDSFSPPFTTKLKAVSRHLLPEKLLPLVSFGFNNVLADYYWISAVQDYTLWDWKNLLYLDYFKNISAVDPKFEYPYLFAILAVPNHKDVVMLGRVASIAKKGIDEIHEAGNGWKIPYYLGTQYYLFTKTFSPAKEYLEIAAKKEGAPNAVYLAYSSFVTKNIEGTKGAQDLIKVIYNNTDNETIKKLASKGFQEDIISQLLEKGIAAYKSTYKKYPITVEELTGSNFIALPAELYDAFIITINPKNGSFRIEERK